ncbi:hypothetical protein ACFX1X_007802 [Malus domestica]
MEFGPPAFEDSPEALFKHCQTGSLRDYISKFRRSATRSPEIGPLLLKSCFIGGLRKELKFDVKILKPVSVHEAISIDDKFAKLRTLIMKSTAQSKPITTTTTHHFPVPY